MTGSSVAFLLCLTFWMGGCSSPFLSTWQTIGFDETITLPFLGAFDIQVDWGDGVSETFTTPATVDHMYTNPGFYNISITGQVQDFYFRSTGDISKIYEIHSWGNFTVTNNLGVFEGCLYLNLFASDQPVFAPNSDLSNFFKSCQSLNAPLNWNISGVTNLFAFLESATNFNSPVNFDTSEITDMSYMFRETPFNQSLTFNTKNVLRMVNMFSLSSFNQPLNFDTRSVTDMTAMFQFNHVFNSILNFTSTSHVTKMAYMFHQAFAFNQRLNFDVSNVTDMRYMFTSAYAFNQPLDWNPVKASNMTGMFLNATIFQQNLGGWNVSSTVSCYRFCAMCGMPAFVNCSTPCSSDAVLSTSLGWVSCQCPPLQTCAPINCTAPYYSGAAGHCVCQGTSGIVSYFNAAPHGCDPPSTSPSLSPSPAPSLAPSPAPSLAPPFLDLCPSTKIGTGLQLNCVIRTPVAPSPGVVIVSPTVNITRVNITDNTTTFVFVIPIISNHTPRGVVVEGCFSTQLRCEWQDHSMNFQGGDCNLTALDVDLGGGVLGAQCTCPHLTVFALVLRTELDRAPLCHAGIEDYVLVGMYSGLASVLIVQLSRLFCARASRRLKIQHSVLLLASLLRIVYLVVKPIVYDTAGLVALGLFPSALSLALFIHILISWASIQIFAMTVSPFAKLRIPFVLIVALLFLSTCGIVIAVALAEGDVALQITTATNGSYFLAALNAAVCFMVLFSGFGLHRLLVTSATSAGQKLNSNARMRILTSTGGISFCLFLAAGLWVAAVQSDILASTAATFAVSVAFYAVDWVSLGMLTTMFCANVNSATTRKQRFVRE